MNEELEKMQAIISQLSMQVRELMQWKQARTIQQLVDPVDDISRRALRAITDGGIGATSPTHTITISSTPQTITVPTNPTGSVFLDTSSGIFEVPHY